MLHEFTVKISDVIETAHRRNFDYFVIRVVKKLKAFAYSVGIEVGKRESFKFANDNSFVQLKESVRGKDVYIGCSIVGSGSLRSMKIEEIYFT